MIVWGAGVGSQARFLKVGSSELLRREDQMPIDDRVVHARRGVFWQRRSFIFATYMMGSQARFPMVDFFSSSQIDHHHHHDRQGIE